MRRKLIVIALGTILATMAIAQPPGPTSGPPQRDNYTFQLMRMVDNIAELDKDKKHALTAAQAKRILALLKPLRQKPKLTQAQAKQALASLKKVFTADQLNAMARIKPKFQPGRRPNQGPPPGGPGGPPPGPPPDFKSGGPHPGPNAMQDFNPFYTKAPKGDKRAEEQVKRMNEFFRGLEAKVK